MKRYEEIDVLRGMGMVGVVLIHVTSIILRDQTGIALYINQFARFAVPVYLFLSGFGLTISNKYKNGYFHFLKEQLQKLIPLYLVWSVIYYGINMDAFSISEFVHQLLMGDANYHLYFVPLIVMLYMIYPFLLSISDKKWFLPAMFAITFLSLDQGFDNVNPLKWVAYFALGIWMAKDYDVKRIRIKQDQRYYVLISMLTLGILWLEASVTDVTTSSRPTVMIYSLIFIGLILSIDWSNTQMKKYLVLISKYSYVIYLCHPALLKVIRKVYNQINVNMPNGLYIVVELGVVLAASILVALVTEKIQSNSRLERKRID